MRKIILAVIALFSLTAQAEVWQGRYGVADTYDFKLYNADGTLDVDEADGGTEVSLSCDEGAETTATNDFVDEGTFYSIAITAAEMRCRRITVVVAATTTEVFFIQTNGAAGVIDEGTAQAATSTTLQLRSAASFADDEILGATCVITSATTGAGQSRTITDYVSSTDTATVATWTTTPTGTITYQCHGTAASSGSISIAAGGITASSFAAGAIDAAAIATDAIGAAEIAADAIASSELATTAVTEIWSITATEPTAKPVWATSTVKQILEWASAWSINKVTQTSTTKTLRNTADSGNLVTCTVSDNGTTFTLSACSP